MNDNLKIKLEDYFSGFISISDNSITPIGAVLVGEEDHDTVTKKAEKFFGAKVINSEALPAEILSIFEKNKGAVAVLDLNGEVPPRLSSLLDSLYRGKVSNAKVLLILNKNQYDNEMTINRLVTSVCRL